jgi:hypothetical protein
MNIARYAQGRPVSREGSSLAGSYLVTYYNTVIITTVKMFVVLVPGDQVYYTLYLNSINLKLDIFGMLRWLFSFIAV